jgi:hypothetical protein
MDKNSGEETSRSVQVENLQKRIDKLLENPEFVTECERFLNRCIRRYQLKTASDLSVALSVMILTFEDHIRKQLDEEQATVFKTLVRLLTP